MQFSPILQLYILLLGETSSRFTSQTRIRPRINASIFSADSVTRQVGLSERISMYFKLVSLFCEATV